MIPGGGQITGRIYLNTRLMAIENYATMWPGLVSPVVFRNPYAPEGASSAVFSHFLLYILPVTP
jgi:hypothetical protein